MVSHNIRTHEFLGLLMIFIGTAWAGYGLYLIMLYSNLILIPGQELIKALHGPLFVGVGAVITVLGSIELREILPGKNR